MKFFGYEKDSEKLMKLSEATFDGTLEELEDHLSITKNSEDKVKARRIIERIKQLTEDRELVSKNRRN